MTKRILVPLDGSPLSERAIATAASLARHHAGVIHLVRVFPPPQLPPTMNAPTDDPGFGIDQRAAADRALARMARRIHRATHLDVTPHLRVGNIVDEIEAVAANTEADLVVMTTHGRGGISRAWLGSVTESLLRHLSIPMVVTQRRMDLTTTLEQGVPFARILVPVDGSPESEAIIEDVSALLHSIPLHFTLAHVVSPTPVMLADLQDASAISAVTHEYLEPLAARIRDGRRTARVVAMNANTAARAIVDLAMADRADLIALRTHARKGLSRFALGSVADKVIRLSRIPVFVRGPD